MDSVRLGRVLGIGTRLAAKTVAAAVDAAKAPNPAVQSPGLYQNGTREEASSGVVKDHPRARAEQAQNRAVRTGRGLKEGSRRFGEAVWGPVVRLSGVLWLELTGVFFGLFALTAGLGAWKLRGGLHTATLGHDARMRFLLAAGMAALFGYFCVSSFVKAARRERRR